MNNFVIIDRHKYDTQEQDRNCRASETIQKPTVAVFLIKAFFVGGVERHLVF